jgi:tRNA-splicing ligase RtcB
MTDHVVFKEDDGKPVKAWTIGVEFEAEARKQLTQLSKLPFLGHHVAVMPDVHAGKGCTVGSVIPTKRVIVPAFVGVDIGCGMIAVQTNLKASDLPDSLKSMRSTIEGLVPHGGPGEIGSWESEPTIMGSLVQPEKLGTYLSLCRKYPDIESKFVMRQFGTLGTGNHFVEVCLDTNQNVWVMLHSGSRGAGNRIGSFFIERAKEEMRNWYINLPDMDMAYLPENSQYYKDYVVAMEWAQNYAYSSRNVMLHNTLMAMSLDLGRPVETVSNAVNCHHNYVSMENHYGENVWVTRKGAVRVRKGELGIIPGSMGTRSYIVRGNGREDTFDSCSHGAGRRMSRGVAKKTFSLEDHANATKGVECRKDEGVIDETPGAYKSIDAVMESQKSNVETVATLKQVLCVKG